MEAARLLLSAGADKNKADADGHTPLWTAAQRGRLNIVGLLLNEDVDMKRVNKFGTSPLWIASACGHNEVVRLLVSAGADTGAANKQGDSPLRIASEGGHRSVMQALLERHNGDKTFAHIGWPLQAAVLLQLKAWTYQLAVSLAYRSCPR